MQPTRRLPRSLTMPRARSWLLAAHLLMLVACTDPTNSGQAVARAFVDRLFVEADQHAALPLTEGVARAKVEEELRLVAETRPGDAAERSRVYYRPIDQRTDGDHVTFYFRLTVMVIGDQPVEPELIVHVRRRGGKWHVSNYEVLPPRSPSPDA